MKAATIRRLEELEARSMRTDAGQNDLRRYDLQVALMVVVAFNAGWAEQDCPATAVARAFGMTPFQLKSAFANESEDGPVWRTTLEKLNHVVTERSGRAIVENVGSMVELPSAEDVLLANRAALEPLYSEVPGHLKARHRMLPDLIDALL